MDAADLIDRLGGNSAVAKITGANAGAVTMWRKRGIPARYWLPVREAAAAQGVEWTPPIPQPAEAAQ